MENFWIPGHSMKVNLKEFERWFFVNLKIFQFREEENLKIRENK